MAAAEPGMTNKGDMRVDEEATTIVPVQPLKQFTRATLERSGVPAQEAAIVTDNLIEADLRSVGSHGVVRLPIYLKRLSDGGTNAKPTVKVTRQTRTTAVVDGDNGLGHLVGVRAMEIAIDKARDGDCAFVAVRNSNHFGAAAYYTEMAARKRMIGFAFTIGAINHMTPWGGAEALLGNNPFSVCFPTGEDFPVVLDMACSIAARGKIIVAAKEGKPIPEGWATGADGLPTTDAVEALKGFVTPLGGPKGYALTLTVGLLSTLLSGAAFGSDVGELYEKTTTAQDSGHLFGALPVESFVEFDTYLERMDKAISDMRGAKKASGVDRIYLPGEREHLSLVERTRAGIPLGKGLIAELREVGSQMNIPFPA